MSSKDNRILFNRIKIGEMEKKEQDDIKALTDKHNQEFAELKKYVSDGKNLLAATLAANWITWASGTNTFEELSTNINSILNNTNATQAQVLATTGAEGTGDRIYFSSKVAGFDDEHGNIITGIHLHGTMTNHTGWLSENEIATRSTLSVTVPEGYHRNSIVQVNATKAYDAGKAEGSTHAFDGTNATPAQVLDGWWFGSAGQGMPESHITKGNMPNNGSVATTLAISTINLAPYVNIPAGYTSGGTISVNGGQKLYNAAHDLGYNTGYNTGYTAGLPKTNIILPITVFRYDGSLNNTSREFYLNQYHSIGYKSIHWISTGNFSHMHVYGWNGSAWKKITDFGATQDKTNGVGNGNWTLKFEKFDGKMKVECDNGNTILYDFIIKP